MRHYYRGKVILVTAFFLFSCGFPAIRRVREVLKEDVIYKEQKINSLCFVGTQLYYQYRIDAGFLSYKALNLWDVDGIKKISRMFVEILSPNIRKSTIDGNIVEEKRRNFYLSSDLRMIPHSYVILKNHYAIFDTDNNFLNDDFLKHSDMHPLCIDFLNENITSENYLVSSIRFDNLIRYSEKEGISFSVSIVITIYNRKGEKIFSKIYRKSFSNIPGDPTNHDIYYNVICQFIRDNSEAINKDLYFIQNINDAPKPNLDDLLENIDK
jgi:hypothetical protein